MKWKAKFRVKGQYYNFNGSMFDFEQWLKRCCEPCVYVIITRRGGEG